MSNIDSAGEWSGSKQWPLWVIAGLALLIGLYGRFKGLGAWPFGVDEFYISRSIDHVLSTGLPQFPCGGYYTRGLIYQYAVALLRLTGAAPEFAGRFVSALTSVAVLPAAFLIGRRLHGPTVGWLLVIVLALSVWEIEMARFARMYAPFQAVFAWYTVFFLRYVLDGDRRALSAMVLLSLLGVMTWEGGVLIGVANFLPLLLNHRNGRWQRSDWIYLLGMTLLLAVLFVASRDLRGIAEAPLTEASGPAAMVSTPPAAAMTGIAALFRHPVWSMLALLPLGLAVSALPWIWTLRRRWLAASGLFVALAATLLHQLLVCGAVLVLLLLAPLCDWREIAARPARKFRWAILAGAVYWIAYGSTSGDWFTGTVMGTNTPSRWTVFAQHLVGFPNVWEEVARPWARTMPLLTIGLFAALLGLTAHEILRRRSGPDPVTVVSVVVLVMLLGVGASGTERIETRYLFFLYPLLFALAITAGALLSEFLSGRQAWAPVATSAATLLFFAATEDFQPYHIANIDSAWVAFRIGMTPWQRDHYYSHSDLRGAARWLGSHVRDGDLVINSIPSLDQYYSRADFFYLNDQDPRYDAYACRGGTMERWTNRPLLYAGQGLQPKVATGRRIFLVIYPGQRGKVLADATARGWRHELAWSSIDGGIDVLLLNP